MPPPAAGEHLTIQVVQTFVIEEGKAGLILAVDNLAELDRDSLELLRRLMFTADIPLIGREDELHLFKETIANEALVTLVGPGGNGKTRLALQTAAERRERFPDGAFFVPLASVAGPGVLIPTIAQALGLTFSGTEDASEHLRRPRSC